ncbi:MULTISPECIES: hypothetical protein [Bacteria]|uniref:hypothetical protein n=1 Tax=Bacteria TaxID=2 RepID=UPI003C7AAC6A
MNAAGRLGLYAAGLAAAFAAAFGAAAAIVPPGAATMQHGEQGEEMDHKSMAGADTGSHGSGETPSHGAAEGHGASAAAGVSLAAGGFVLDRVDAPAATGERGILSFRILDAAGSPVTAFEESHDKQLHLIVVRADGSGFRHVHPTLDTASGVWSVPWTWEAAGTYRLYADIAPVGGAPVTLSRTVDVAGAYTPVPAAPRATATVDGYEVSVGGDLVAGGSSTLTVEVRRGGEPVTALEPYLGAFGHLVALREGDLAYLHVHAEGGDPAPGETSGPTIAFAAHAPTAGRYLLYLDFQVDGVVRTASFVLDASSAPTAH